MPPQPVTKSSTPSSSIPVLNILRAFLVEETDDIQSEKFQIFTSVPVVPVRTTPYEMMYSELYVVKQLKSDSGYDQHWGVAIGQAHSTSRPLPLRDLVAINLDDPTREVNWVREFADKMANRPFHTNAIVVEGPEGVLSVPESSVYAGIWERRNGDALERSNVLTDKKYAILPGKRNLIGTELCTDTPSLMTLGKELPAFLRVRPHDFEYWFEPKMQSLHDSGTPSIDDVIAAVSSSCNRMPALLRQRLQLPPSFYSAPERSSHETRH